MTTDPKLDRLAALYSASRGRSVDDVLAGREDLLVDPGLQRRGRARLRPTLEGPGAKKWKLSTK